MIQQLSKKATLVDDNPHARTKKMPMHHAHPSSQRSSSEVWNPMATLGWGNVGLEGGEGGEVVRWERGGKEVRVGSKSWHGENWEYRQRMSDT